MATTYDKIATTTLGSANNTITFSAIPSTYTDLRFVFVGATTAANDPYIRFNGDSSSIYSQTAVSGDGSSATSSQATVQSSLVVPGGRQPSANVRWMWELDLFSYTASVNKTCLFKISMDKNGSGSTNSAVGLYRSTSTISSFTLSIPTTTFTAGSTATLYGILKA
jgi:hypothetical protein